MSIISLLMILAYFFPSIVAALGNHPHRAGIVVVNFFLGWTLLGWVAALAWAVCAPRNVVVTSIQVAPNPAQDWDRTKIYGLPEGPSTVDKLEGFKLE